MERVLKQCVLVVSTSSRTSDTEKVKRHKNNIIGKQSHSVKSLVIRGSQIKKYQQVNLVKESTWIGVASILLFKGSVFTYFHENKSISICIFVHQN